MGNDFVLASSIRNSKIILPMTLAWFLSLSEDKDINIQKLIASFMIIFLPIAFVIKQPDLGTS